MAALAWPIALTNLSQMAMIATDIALLGRVSAEAMAGATIGGNFFYLFFPLVFGVAMATAPMLAQARGRKLHHVRDMRRTVRQGFWACLGVCLLIWPVLWQAESLLLALGQSPRIAELGAEFCRAIMWELLPFGWYMVLRGFLAALERPLPALAVAVFAVLFNALLAWALILGHFGLPALGVTGAGMASAISGCVLFLGLTLVVLFDRRIRRYRLLGRFWRADWPRFFEIFRIGLPIGLAFLFEISVFNAAAFMMGWISTAAVAAHAVAINIASLTFMVPMGLSQAATARVGLAAGAGDYVAAGRAGWAALAMAGGFMTCTATVMILLPHLLVRIFVDANDPSAAEAMSLAVGFLFLAGLFQIADGLQAVGAGALRGLSDTRVPMIYAGLGYWGIGFPSAYGLAFWAGWAGTGIWAGLVIGLLVVSAMMVRRWARRGRLGLATARPGSVQPHLA